MRCDLLSKVFASRGDILAMEVRFQDELRSFCPTWRLYCLHDMCLFRCDCGAIADLAENPRAQGVAVLAHHVFMSSSALKHFW